MQKPQSCFDLDVYVDDCDYDYDDDDDDDDDHHHHHHDHYDHDHYYSHHHDHANNDHAILIPEVSSVQRFRRHLKAPPKPRNPRRRGAPQSWHPTPSMLRSAVGFFGLVKSLAVE